MTTGSLTPDEYCWVYRTLEKRRILSESNGALSETESYIIDSCLARQDLQAAKQHIRDWNERREGKRTSVDISKWIPGDHYYALNEKFNDLKAAIDYLHRRGFRFSGNVRERFQYRESGG